MTAPTFFTAILALCALALAVAMSFTSAGDIEKAGFWLLAAVAAGICVLIHAEETRPSSSRAVR